MESENMKFLLSTITQFDKMKGKQFSVKKCKTACPRIAALQRSLGFGPGEPVNAKNFHRIIPAAKDIGLILNKRNKTLTPVQKIQPRQVSTPRNQISANFRVNSRFETPVPSKSSIKKISSQHDIVGEILKGGLSTTVPPRFCAPSTTKSSTVQVAAPQNRGSRILKPGSAKTTSATSCASSASTATDVTCHNLAPNAKYSSFVKDEVHSSKNPDGYQTSSQESGISVSTEASETSNQEKENEIPNLTFY